MNNDNFEQQFKQNIQNATAHSVAPPSQPSKLPMVIIAALSIVLVVESIALTITLINYFAITSSEKISDNYQPIAVESPNTGNSYIYDQDDNIIAMSATCTNENGASFVLDTQKNFKEYSASGSLTNSGTYSMSNGFIVSLSGDSKRNLYFENTVLAEGDVIYDCKTDSTSNQTSD